MELLGEFFITGKATIVHCQFLANSTDCEFGRAGQPEHQLVCRELFEFTDGMDSEEMKGVSRLWITLENHVQRSVDGNPGTPEFAGVAGFSETGRQSRLPHTLAR